MSNCQEKTDYDSLFVELEAASSEKNDSPLAAIHEIKCLNEKLAELQRENEWVSVEDRLPEESLEDSAGTISVAVWVNFDGGLWLQSQYDLESKTFGIDDHGGININEYVTHWKPITAPKEGGQMRPEIDEIWYVKFSGASTLVAAKILDLTAKTVELGERKNIAGQDFWCATGRRKIIDVEFVEKVG